jgi:type VI secretion system secreted protein Hcp
MAVDMFLKIDDIKGDSADAKHKGEIDVLSFAWGMTQTGSTHHAKGGGTGKVSVQDLSFTKYIDRSTPNLIQYCCNGFHFKQAVLTIRKAGGKNPVEYLVIKLKDIIVSSVSTGGGGADEQLTEHITLNFGQFEVDYTPQKPDGTADASIPAKFNIAENTSS